MANQTPLLSAAEYRALLRLDLLSFVDRSFGELNPGQELSIAPHLEPMCATLASALTGKGPRRLIVNLPPRSLKSITFSVAGVAWALGHDPTLNIICASYSQPLANKLAHDTRTVMSSRFYRDLFPRTRLSTQKQAVNDFMTTQQGFRMATSVGGTLTGRGADILVIDDPLKADDALSETQRTAVNDWYDNTLLSRLNSKEDGIILLVMQRLHQDDLAGHLLDRDEGWEVLRFPAIATGDERLEYTTVFGPKTFTRQQGDVLDPGRESRETLEGLRRSMGSYNFDAQYQQDPSPVGGAIVKAEWLRYYEPGAPLPSFGPILQSWDTANKSGELNDFSVCTTWGTRNNDFYLLDVYRQRLNYPELKRQVMEQKRKYGTQFILIEDRASGTQLIQELKAVGVYGIKGYEPPPQTDKILRLHARTALFEAGRVLLPSHAPWLAEYQRELLTFPGTRHDDQVDSTTQALDFLERRRSPEKWARLAQGLTEFYPPRPRPPFWYSSW